MIRNSIVFVMILMLSVSALALSEQEVKNFEGMTLPKAAGTMFGDEQINIHILHQADPETIYGIVTKDSKVVSIVAGGVEKPTLNVYLQDSTLEEIQKAKNPGPVFLNSLKEKKIWYKGVGLVKKMKFAFLSAYVKTAGLFGPKEAVENMQEETQQDSEAKDDSVVDGSVKEKKETETAEKSAEDPTEDLVTGNIIKELKKENTYFIDLNEEGFSPKELSINTGDKVVWQNVRTGKINRAMVIGVRECSEIRSKFLMPGESFTWTFKKPKTCTIVDGIMTTVQSQIIVK
ncbi:MAG: hypothetical protein AABX05_06190 [Nanoarchaeota archaeon]